MCHNGDTRLAVDIIVVSVTVSAAVYRPQMMCLRQKSLFIVRFVFQKKVYIYLQILIIPKPIPIVCVINLNVL